MYLVKYILLNTVCHSYTILFIVVSIKNIVDMSGNKQFVKTRPCLSFIRRNHCTARDPDRKETEKRDTEERETYIQ